MKKKLHRKKFFLFFEPLIIITFWVLLFSSPIFLGSNDDGIVWEQILKVWKSFLPYLILFFIVHFLLLPLLFFRNKKWLFLLSAILLIVIMAIGVFLQSDNNQPPGRRGNPQLTEKPLLREFPPVHPGPNREVFPKTQPPPKQLPPHLAFIIISILIVGFDTGLKLSVKWVQSEQKRINAEKESMESQLAFLRNQISPHFFMNTLNNIHSLIDIDVNEAKESIIRLSKLMRHLLYDSEIEHIPIQKEIDFIQNYVDLMKLRYSDKVIINLTLPDQLPDKKIPPLLFTSFLENAFKHGISYQHTTYINIKISCEREMLRFEIRNNHPELRKEDEAGGIGIENSRRRLHLIYGDNYTLNIEDQNNEYKVNLSIPL